MNKYNIIEIDKNNLYIMDWLNLFLIVCLILHTFHFSVRINTLEKSVENWSQSVVDECNRQLNESVVGYKAKVSDWLTDYIDNLQSSLKVKDSGFDDENSETSKVFVNEK